MTTKEERRRALQALLGEEIFELNEVQKREILLRHRFVTHTGEHTSYVDFCYPAIMSRPSFFSKKSPGAVMMDTRMIPTVRREFSVGATMRLTDDENEPFYPDDCNYLRLVDDQYVTMGLYWMPDWLTFGYDFLQEIFPPGFEPGGVVTR